MSRQGRAVPRGTALLIPLLLAACASTEDLTADALLNQGAVVTELRPGAVEASRERRGNAAAATEEADRADALLAAGDAAAALETVRRALLENPPAEEAERLRGIRIEAKRRFLRDAVARGEIGTPGPFHTEGDPLPLVVRLRNLTPVPLTIAPAPAGVSPTTARVTVTRTAHDVFGNRRSDTWEELVHLPTGTVAPGAVLGTDLLIDTHRFHTTRPHGWVEYAIEGVILPSSVRAGEVDLHEPIPILDASVRAFPQRGWTEVAAAPAEHLERALANDNPVRVLVAAACTPADLRPGAIRRLEDVRVRADAPGGVMATAIEAAIRALGATPVPRAQDIAPSYSGAAR